MDLVSRLKQYLNTRGISITQFADECDIPRPSASQLLAGRNKKVSDEIIGKIHYTYPELSVSWLMFGEGEMVIDNNIATSKPQNEPTSAEIDTQKLIYKNISHKTRIFFLSTILTQKNPRCQMRKNFHLQAIPLRSQAIRQPHPLPPPRLRLKHRASSRPTTPLPSPPAKANVSQESLYITATRPTNHSFPIRKRNIRLCDKITKVSPTTNPP